MWVHLSVLWSICTSGWHIAIAPGMDSVEPMLWMASCSLVVCVFLCIAKLYLASKLRSPALKKDGITSGAVALLSAGIILSSAVYKKNKNIWWLDSAVAVTVAIVLFIYGGRSLIRNKWYNKEFWSPTELPSSVPGPDGGNAVPLEKLLGKLRVGFGNGAEVAVCNLCCCAPKCVHSGGACCTAADTG